MTDPIRPSATTITADPEASQALVGGFRALYGAIAVIAAVVALVVRPELLLAVAAGSVMLLAWSRQIGEATAVPTALVVADDHLAFTQGGVEQRVERRQAEVRIEDRWLGRTVGTWPVLVALDSAGAAVLEVTLWDEQATRAALLAHGWLPGQD